MQESKNHNPFHTSTSQTSTTSLASHSVRYPYLQKTLRKVYSEKGSLSMPLSEGLFPIQAISLTINVKETQQIRDEELIHPKEDTKEKEQKNYGQAGKLMSASRPIPKEFGMPQLEREAAWHKVEKPVLVADISGGRSFVTDTQG